MSPLSYINCLHTYQYDTYISYSGIHENEKGFLYGCGFFVEKDLFNCDLTKEDCIQDDDKLWETKGRGL